MQIPYKASLFVYLTVLLAIACTRPQGQEVTCVYDHGVARFAASASEVAPADFKAICEVGAGAYGEFRTASIALSAP